MAAVLQTLLVAFSLLCALLTVVPFFKLPHGLVRGPAFARLQLLVAAVLCLPLAAFFLTGPWRLVTLAALAGTVIVNGIAVLKFTPLWPKQSFDADDALMDQPDRHIELIAANVKMSNRRYDLLIDLIRDEDADIVAVIEPDARWIDALSAIRPLYPHRVEHPLDTGYGLALYSKLPLSQTDLRCRITDGVPSITTTVTLPSGDDIRLYIVHPEPPIASHDTSGRDSEIAAAGLEAVEDGRPVIIAGDLNDVAWSHTTRRFQRITGLLDPRVGRGFYNTFNAFYPVFRWPLDHLFHDKHFRFVDMARLPKINSDHFPVAFTLALSPERAGDAPDGDAQERQEVEQMIEDERARDRQPIGTDWEDDG